MKRIVLPVIILCLSLLSIQALKAQGRDTAVRTWSLNGYVKDLQTTIFNNINKQWITDNMIHNRLNFKYFPIPTLTAALELRNRLVYGELVKSIPGYAELVASDDGIIDLSANLADHESWLLNTSVDRAWIDINREKWQVTLGRQRINWGQTFVWNPNDIFNTYSFFDFDYEEKPGSDAVRVQYFTGPASRIEAAVKSNSRKQLTAAGLYKFNRWEYDFQLLAGTYHETDWVLGAGWSGQLAKGGLRGEISWFRSREHSPVQEDIVLASAGYDYSFRNSLFLQAEVLYNSNKQSVLDFSPANTAGGSLDAKNLFLNDFSYFLAVSYPFTPLLKCSLSGIANPVNRMGFLVPSLEYSMADNLDFSLVGQFFQDYHPKAVTPSTSFVFLRLRFSY